MTISSTSRKAGPFSGTGVQTAFPFSFKVFATSDVLVVQTDALGVEHSLSLNTDYSVALNGNQDTNPGGTVTLPAALPIGQLLTIGSALPLTQGVSIPNMGGFYPRVIEQALDKLTITAQQAADTAGRTLRFAFSDPNASGDLPTSAIRRGKFLAFDASGNPTAASGTGADGALRTDLASPTGGSSLVGFMQDFAGAATRTMRDKAAEIVSVEDSDTSGTVGTGGDDTASIQAAIDNATGELWFTKPAYRVDGQLIWKNGIIYRGRGVNIFGVGGTKITFNATSQDASVIVNPLNTSTPANISFRDLYLYAPSLEAEKAVIADTGSSYGTIEGCRLYSSGDCLHLDQSEIWCIEKNSFLLASASSVGIWLINGPDKQAGSLPYFTNQITARSNDFNGAAGSVHIRDDGGVSHTFENNNHNGGGSHIIATGVNGLKVDGGEYEASSAQTLILGVTKRKGGAGAKSPMVSINRTYLYNNVGQPVLAMVAGAVGKLEFTNNVISTIPGAAVTGLAVGCDQIDAQGNIQIGSVDDDIDLNNVLDVNPAAVGWLAQTTSPSIGNGTIVGSYSRRGKLVTLRQKVTFGSTTTPGTGGYLFPLPFAADPSTFAQLGAVFIIIPGIGFYSGVARITTDGLNAELYTTNNTVVGGAAPDAWVSDSTIEFQITYVTAAPI